MQVSPSLFNPFYYAEGAGCSHIGLGQSDESSDDDLSMPEASNLPIQSPILLEEILLEGDVSGISLLEACQKSQHKPTKLTIGGALDKQVTTLTRQDLLNLNDATQHPHLLMNLKAFHIDSTIEAEDVKEFLCELEEGVDLEELTLNAPMTDAQLSAILARHLTLKKLILDVSKLTDEGFLALAARGSEFVVLSLSKCSKSISGDSIDRLFSSLSHIENLALFGQTKIDAESLLVLLLNASKMVSAYLSECHITGEEIELVFEEVAKKIASSDGDHLLRLGHLRLQENLMGEKLLCAINSLPKSLPKLNDYLTISVNGCVATTYADSISGKLNTGAISFC